MKHKLLIVVAVAAALNVGIASIALADNTPAGAIATVNSGFQHCLQDPGNTAISGTLLNEWDGCYTNQGTQWHAVWSSYVSPALPGQDWGYSIELKNSSNGNMCIDDPDPNHEGTQLKIKGCNGSESQSWAPFCVQSLAGPRSGEIEPTLDTGQSMDLYGDHMTDGTPWVGWNFEDPAPDALSIVDNSSDLLGQAVATCENTNGAIVRRQFLRRQ